MQDPKSGRPHMPGYGVPGDTDGALPWSWARERLERAHNYWLATVRPDGRPHVMAVWGLWMDDAFWFSTSATSRKARNIARNPNCAVTTEHADEAVMVEGVAAPVSGADTLGPFVEAYKRKYDWDMDPAGDGYFVVTPRMAFGFIEHADQFAKTSTRWTF
jgi:PPOX class probable F420-dependent enzyme